MTSMPSSPLLNELYQTKEKLDAKANSRSANVTALRKQQADGIGNADNSESNLAMVLAGEDVTFAPDIDAQLSTEMQQWRVINEAQDILERKIRAETFKVNLNYCTTEQKPAFDKLMKKLCPLLVEANAVHTEIFAMKRFLIDNQIGLLAGVYDINPEPFLGMPNNRYSEFADFLRDAKRLGYIAAVPKGLV